MTLYIQKGFRPSNNNSRFYTPKEPENKIYALSSKDQIEYRFHIGQLQGLKEHMSRNGYDESFYKIDKVETKPYQKLKCIINPKFNLRDRQPEVVDFILKELDSDNSSRLITLEPGYGKGLISLWACIQRQSRVAYIILPQYIEKTKIEILEKTTAKPKDVMIIQGSDSIRGLIELAKTNQYNSDFLLISNKTWINYINSYLTNAEFCIKDEYGCAPEELFSLLGIGTVVFDEIHQHLHAVFQSFCTINVGLVIGMSATFLSNDSFVDRIQHLMFPRELRFNKIETVPHVKAYGISYVIKYDSLQKIRTTERGNSVYSQNAFEESILKNKQLSHQYLKLIEEVVANGFMDQYKPGYKCIIFVRRVETCQVVVNHLKAKYPHLDIRKYTQEDPYENLQDPVIRVTTQKSAGTGHDIPGLMTVITLDNINSPAANIQTIGRLRKPKEGIARYFTVYSENIPKHEAYYIERKQLLRDRVESFKDFRSNIVL